MPEIEIAEPAPPVTTPETNSGNPLAEFHAQLDLMLENTIRIPGKPAWIILCGYAIGETALFCSLADAFVKEHGHGIILLITPKHAMVAKMYAHRFLKIMTIPEDLMRAMLRSNYIPQDRFELNMPLSGCWIDRGFRYSDGIKYIGRYPGRGGISESDMMRFVLRLPWNAKLEAPRILPEWEDAAWQLARQKGLRLGKSVLLCPICNSNPRFPDVFWSTLARHLLDAGYVVFTNMGGLNNFNAPPTMPIAGTIPVELPINLVIPFANFAGRMISGGNGMCLLTFLSAPETFKMVQLQHYEKKAPPTHSSLGCRAPLTKGQELIGTMQFALPELCLKVPLTEYLVPTDGTEDELRHIARMVAEQNTSDAACYKRYECNGRLYIEEHADWLRDLV